MNFFLEIDHTKGIYDDGVKIGDILLEGGQIVLIGMVTVFAVLGLLWACLTVFKMVFNNVSAKSEGISTPETNEAPVAYQINNASQDEELVAVIAAAIAAAESESTGIKYRVVSFRRN